MKFLKSFVSEIVSQSGKIIIRLACYRTVAPQRDWIEGFVNTKLLSARVEFELRGVNLNAKILRKKVKKSSCFLVTSIIVSHTKK